MNSRGGQRSSIDRTATLLVALGAVAGCSRSVSPLESNRRYVPPAATPRSSLLEPGATPPVPAVPRPLPAPRAPALADPGPVQIRVVRVRTAEGEDGHGNTVRAADPVAIDLDAPHGWPGRGLALSLRVGDRQFYTPGYPTPTTMRFVAADGRDLPRGAEVALQYGPDVTVRRVLAASLPEPR